MNILCLLRGRILGLVPIGCKENRKGLGVYRECTIVQEKVSKYPGSLRRNVDGRSSNLVNSILFDFCSYQIEGK